MPASEERSISEFPSALSILATTLLLVSTYDSGNDAYDSEKVTAVDLASAILGDFEFTQDLATNAKTIFGAINELNEFNTMGAETPISTTAPFVEYRVCGHLLFVQINTWDHAITSDETLGYIPNTITVLMQGRQYTSTGLIAIDKTDGRIWARNLATYSAFLFVLPIA